MDSDGPVARQFFLGLPSWWAADDVTWIDALKQARGAGRTHYQQLGDIVTAVTAGNETDMSKAFTSHVRHFVKQRDSNQQFPYMAIFLWNAARRRGRTCALPEETSMFLFTLPERDNP